MASQPFDEAPSAAPNSNGLARLLRERDQLLSLHEALIDVQRAATLEQRLHVMVQAIERLGYDRVETVERYSLSSGAKVLALISNSAFLDTNELIVPLRAVHGATVATLVLRTAPGSAAPTLASVRTVELFAQQVASIIEAKRSATSREPSVRRCVRRTSCSSHSGMPSPCCAHRAPRSGYSMATSSSSSRGSARVRR
jgi:hypothetical protein